MLWMKEGGVFMLHHRQLVASCQLCSCAALVRVRHALRVRVRVRCAVCGVVCNAQGVRWQMGLMADGRCA
jgi:hypothetical protein